MIENAYHGSVGGMATNTYGRVDQLEDRYLGMVEAPSSNLGTSTTFDEIINRQILELQQITMGNWCLEDEMSPQEEMEFSFGRRKFFEARTDDRLIELFDSIYSQLLKVLEHDRDVLHFFDTIQTDYVRIIVEALDREITDIFEKCCFISDILLTHVKDEYHPNSNYEQFVYIIENSLNYFKRIWSDNQDTISGDWFYAIAQKCAQVRGHTRIISSTIWTFERKKLTLIDSGRGQI